MPETSPPTAADATPPTAANATPAARVPGPAAGSPPGSKATAYDRALHHLGRAIVVGALPPGHVDTLDGFEARTGASRSVVREATRVLVTLGLLTSARRVGLRILPASSWNVLDPLVITWRLEGPGRQRQLDELRDLRLAVEPEAARLAADRRSHDQAGRIRDAAASLRVASAYEPAPTGRAGAEAYLQADQLLHGLVLEASQNSLFSRLRTVIDTALRERADVPVDPVDVDLHAELARAIDDGDADRAGDAMRRIVIRTSVAPPSPTSR